MAIKLMHTKNDNLSIDQSIPTDITIGIMNIYE
jgi:hypothetical protein